MPNHTTQYEIERMKQIENMGNFFKQKRCKDKRFQADIVSMELCQKTGIFTNTSDVSRFETGKPDIWNKIAIPDLLIICTLYNVDISDILNSAKNLTAYNASNILNNRMFPNKIDDQPFINEYDHDAFKGYRGIFYCYHRSSDNKNKIIQSTLEIVKDEDNRSMAILKVNNDESKRFYGEVIYSTFNESSYAFLKLDQTGDFGVLQWLQCMTNSDESELCLMANVLTSTAGRGTRFPTFLNMLMVKQELNASQIDKIKPLLGIHHDWFIVNNKKAENLKITKDILDITSVNASAYSIIDRKSFEKGVFTHIKDGILSKEDINTMLMNLLSISESTINNVRLSTDLDTFVHDYLFDYVHEESND